MDDPSLVGPSDVPTSLGAYLARGQYLYGLGTAMGGSERYCLNFIWKFRHSVSCIASITFDCGGQGTHSTPLLWPQRFRYSLNPRPPMNIRASVPFPGASPTNSKSSLAIDFDASLAAHRPPSSNAGVTMGV